MIAAIAQHLKIKAETILKVEEWKTVLFVVIKGVGGRFLSKKVAFKNGSKEVFKRFLKSHVRDWNLFDLKLLNHKQLQSLCILLGSSHSGIKTKLINKIKTIVKVRLIVTPFAKLKTLDTWQQSELFSKQYKHRELKSFCKLVRIYAPSNKLGMSRALICWLLNSLVRGQRAFDDAKKAHAT